MKNTDDFESTDIQLRLSNFADFQDKFFNQDDINKCLDEASIESRKPENKGISFFVHKIINNIESELLYEIENGNLYPGVNLGEIKFD